MRRRTGYLDCARRRTCAASLRRCWPASPTISCWTRPTVLIRHDDRAALASLLDDLAVGSADLAVIIGVRDPAAVADLLPAHHTTVSLSAADLVDAQRNSGSHP